jgi:hypothetical protein
MTTTLHAHVSTASRDCDGPMYREWVEAMNDDEIAEHEAAEVRGYNDFSDLHFKGRVLSGRVSFHSERGCQVEITDRGFEVSEPTDEGYSSSEVLWCEDEDCDPNAASQRDVFAEQMGY